MFAGVFSVTEAGEHGDEGGGAEEEPVPEVRDHEGEEGRSGHEESKEPAAHPALSPFNVGEAMMCSPLSESEINGMLIEWSTDRKVVLGDGIATHLWEYTGG